MLILLLGDCTKKYLEQKTMVSIRYDNMMYSIKHLKYVLEILDYRLQVLKNEKYIVIEEIDRDNEIEFYLSLRNQVTSKIQEMTTLSKDDFSSEK
jgi:hypothetical protein